MWGRGEIQSEKKLEEGKRVTVGRLNERIGGIKLRRPSTVVAKLSVSGKREEMSM